jgi:hypothetical protein
LLCIQLFVLVSTVASRMSVLPPLLPVTFPSVPPAAAEISASVDFVSATATPVLLLVDGDDASTGATATTVFSAADETTTSACFASLDVDALSVVLSFLPTRVFLAAARCSRRLYAARLKKSAWPPLGVETLMQSLRNDDATHRDVAAEDDADEDDERDDDNGFTVPRRRLCVDDLLGVAGSQFLAQLPSVDYLPCASPAPSPTVGAIGCSNSSGRGGRSTLTPLPSSKGRLWRNVHDVRLSFPLFTTGTGTGSFMLEQTLLGLARLPHLAALELRGIGGLQPPPSISTEVVAQVYSAMAGQLHSLLLRGHNSGGGGGDGASDGLSLFLLAFVEPLPLLAPSLRVLELCCHPPASALMVLEQLECLRIVNPSGLAERESLGPLASAMRHLSTRHALRSLTLCTLDDLLLVSLLCLPEDAEKRLAVTSKVRSVYLTTLPPLARHIDPSLPSRLTDLSLLDRPYGGLNRSWLLEPLLAGLPALERLQAVVLERVFAEPVPHLDVLAKLKQLHLKLPGESEATTGQEQEQKHDDGFLTLAHVRQCTQLRSLHLDHRLTVSLDFLVSVLQRNGSTLEELRITGRQASLRLEGAYPVVHERLRTCCPRLRRVELPLTDGSGVAVASLLSALRHAPALQSVSLHCWSPFQIAHHLDDLVASMAASVSWCSTHLYLTQTQRQLDESDDKPLADAAAMEAVWPAAALLATSLSRATLQRMRILMHRADTTDCFVLRRMVDATNEQGSKLQWHLHSTAHRRLR